MSIKNLNKIVTEYLRFVFSMDEDDNCVRWCDKTTAPDFDEYLEETFKFSATNNWESGFDIVDWYESRGDYALDGHYKCGRQGSINDLLDFQTTCDVINFIQEYFLDNYGDECLMDTLNLTPEKVIRNYAYVFCYEKDIDELKEILNIKYLSNI